MRTSSPFVIFSSKMPSSSASSNCAKDFLKYLNPRYYLSADCTGPEKWIAPAVLVLALAGGTFYLCKSQKILGNLNNNKCMSATTSRKASGSSMVPSTKKSVVSEWGAPDVPCAAGDDLPPAPAANCKGEGQIMLTVANKGQVIIGRRPEDGVTFVDVYN